MGVLPQILLCLAKYLFVSSNQETLKERRENALPHHFELTTKDTPDKIGKKKIHMQKQLHFQMCSFMTKTLLLTIDKTLIKMENAVFI